MRKSKGTLTQRKAGGTYYLEWYVQGRRFKKALRNPGGSKITTKREAEKERDRILKPLMARDQEDRVRDVAHALKDAETITLEAEAAAKPKLKLCNVWQEFPYTHSAARHGRTMRRRLAPESVYDYRCQWGRFTAYMEQEFSEVVNAEDVTEAHADELAKLLRGHEGLGPNRVDKILRTCSVMMRASVGSDPFANVQRESIRAKSRKNLELAELDALFRAADGEFLTLFTLGFYTAMRLKDCCLLRWDEHVRLADNHICVDTSKTGKVVLLKMHPRLRSVLELLPHRDGYVCPGIAAQYLKNKATLSKAIKRVFEGAGLETDEVVEGQRRKASIRNFHSFRHSLVTICARAGVPEGAVMRWVGHDSASVHRIYAHFDSDHGDDWILNALPDVGQGLLPAGEGLREKAQRLLSTATDDQLQQIVDLLS